MMLALAGILMLEGSTSLSRDMRRRREFSKALDAARVLQKPLVVVGLSLIHISEPTRQEAISYAVFCLKKKNN